MSLTIEKLKLCHVDESVAVHMEAFPGFFLSSLGPSFLREFYRSFCEDPVAVAFVALDENRKVRGVVVGSLNPSGYYKRLMVRRWWAFAIASFGVALRCPRTVSRLVGALFYRGGAPRGWEGYSLYSSIAVDPAMQGKGVAKELSKRWLWDVYQRGGKKAFLTTDAKGNDYVKRFYEKVGWRLDHGYITRQGRRMDVYTWDFSTQKISI